MKQNFTFMNLIRVRFWALLISALLLTACGGGNGPAGKPLGPGDFPSGVTNLTLLNGAGQAIEVIPTSAPLIAVAHVSDVFGNPITAQLVTFPITTGTDAGSLSPSDGYATTDSNGNARIFLNYGTSGEVGELTAFTTVDNEAISDTIAFSSQ